MYMSFQSKERSESFYYYYFYLLSFLQVQMYKIYINKTVHIEASDRLPAPIRGHFPQCKKQAVCTL